MSDIGQELIARLKRLNEQIEDYEIQIRHAENERSEVQEKIDDMNAKYVTIPEGTKTISWFGKDWNGEWVFCCCHAPREIGEWRYDEGTVQQLAFWDRELSDDELWELEKSDGSLPKLEGLIAWYSMNGEISPFEYRQCDVKINITGVDQNDDWGDRDFVAWFDGHSITFKYFDEDYKPDKPPVVSLGEHWFQTDVIQK